MSYPLKASLIAKFGTDLDKKINDYAPNFYKSSLNHLPSFLSSYSVRNDSCSEIELFSNAYKFGDYIFLSKIA